MKKAKYFLLACLMMFSICANSASAASVDTVQPLWDNTYDVYIGHVADGTTAHCYVDIGIRDGAVLKNVSIRLICMEPPTAELVQEWSDPEMTVDSLGTHSFYDTVEGVVPGYGYRLVLQCEVWHNGVCDSISQYCDAEY